MTVAFSPLRPGRPGRPRRGRPPRLDRERVLARAGAMDPSHFSMTELARALDVTPAALYHYFPNRDAVATELAADLLDRIELPDPDLPWRRWLVDYAGALRAAVLGSPWGGHMMAGPAPIAAGVRHVDAAVGVLTRAGIDPVAAIDAMRVLMYLTASVAQADAAPPSGADRAQLVALVTAEETPVPHVASASPFVGSDDPTERFDRFVRLVIAGLATLAPEDSP